MHHARPRVAFRHVVSLGYFCSTALELERYGLRDGSYPFDWVTCGLEPTLSLIESGFVEFLAPNRLARIPGHEYIVRDTQSGISFYHDFEPDAPVMSQLERVRGKYARRIARFYAAVAEPTLFVRYIENQQEYEYLSRSLDSVLELLRRWNPDNGILLVGNVGLPASCAGVPVYTVKPDRGDTVARQFIKRSMALRLRFFFLRYPLARRFSNYRFYRTSKRIRRSAGSE